MEQFLVYALLRSDLAFGKGGAAAATCATGVVIPQLSDFSLQPNNVSRLCHGSLRGLF